MAILMAIKNPDFSQKRIAREVGCSPSTLSESKSFRKVLAANRGEVPCGSKYDGRVETDDQTE